MASDLGLHCLSLIQQFLDILTGSKMDLFKLLYGKYGNDLMCLNITDTCNCGFTLYIGTP